MKKLIYIIILFYPLVLSAVEKTKEEKVAKYIIQNIQKDYVTCYSFYKVGAEIFKKTINVISFKFICSVWETSFV